VAGAGIVPGVGAFQRRPVQRLENLDAKRRFKFLEKHGQSGAHDAGADKNDVSLVARSPVHGRVCGRSLRRLKRNGGTLRQHDMDAAPRLFVDQFPAVAAAASIFREQDLTGTQDEVLSAPGLEVERAAERDDELPGGRVVPCDCPPEAVSWNDTLVTGSLSVRMSLREPCSGATPSSKWELSSAPVQRRAHFIIDSSRDSAAASRLALVAALHDL
jgi:hypothetical protein